MQDRKNYLSVLILALLVISACATQGQNASQTGVTTKSKVLTAAEQKLADEAKEGQKKFAGVSFGVGLSLTIDTGGNDRIESAEIIDNVVRVTSENNNVARIMLESHYFFLPKRPFFQVEMGNWGIGPFVAIQPGTKEVIEAIGGGVMLGFKRPDNTGNSWNIGLGFVTDPNVKILGDGFVQNQAPPGTETQVRFKETSQTGLLLIVSFGF